MHSFVEVIAALNDVKDRGIVSAYAIGDAMAVKGYETWHLLALSSRRCEPGKPGYDRNGLPHRSKRRCKLS